MPSLNFIKIGIILPSHKAIISIKWDYKWKISATFLKYWSPFLVYSYLYEKYCFSHKTKYDNPPTINLLSQFQNAKVRIKEWKIKLCTLWPPWDLNTILETSGLWVVLCSFPNPYVEALTPSIKCDLIWKRFFTELKWDHYGELQTNTIGFLIKT